MAAPDLSIALAYLLRGPVHAEDTPAVWTSITTLGPQLREHLDVLGMRLVVDDIENYAYLRQLDELPDGMPRLVRRHSLTFTQTVLLISAPRMNVMPLVFSTNREKTTATSTTTMATVRNSVFRKVDAPLRMMPAISAISGVPSLILRMRP